MPMALSLSTLLLIPVAVRGTPTSQQGECQGVWPRDATRRDKKRKASGCLSFDCPPCPDCNDARRASSFPRSVRNSCLSASSLAKTVRGRQDSTGCLHKKASKTSSACKHSSPPTSSHIACDTSSPHIARSSCPVLVFSACANPVWSTPGAIPLKVLPNPGSVSQIRGRPTCSD